MAENIVEIKSRFSNRPKAGLSFSKDNPESVSRAKQSFRKEADINCIMSKYAKSGLLTDPMCVSTRMPQFGDFSAVYDFQSMQNRVIEVRNYFESLPADVRKRFDNDPQKLMEFMADDKNKDEALRLGLLSHDLSKIKYFRKDENGNEVDVTAEVIEKRGLFVNGKRVNLDGTPYVKPVDKTAAGPTS